MRFGREFVTFKADNVRVLLNATVTRSDLPRMAVTLRTRNLDNRWRAIEGKSKFGGDRGKRHRECPAVAGLKHRSVAWHWQRPRSGWPLPDGPCRGSDRSVRYWRDRSDRATFWLLWSPSRRPNAHVHARPGADPRPSGTIAAA